MDIRENFTDVLWCRTLVVDHHLQRFRVVHHRAERLAKLMRNRTGQRRHGRAPTHIRASASSAARALPAVAGREQQPDDQQRLTANAPTAIRTVPQPTQEVRGPEMDHAARRQATFGCPISAVHAVVSRFCRHCDGTRYRPVKRHSDFNGHFRRGSRAGRCQGACRPRCRSRGRRYAPKTGHSRQNEDRHHPLIGIRSTRCVGAEGKKENRRIRRKG